MGGAGCPRHRGRAPLAPGLQASLDAEDIRNEKVKVLKSMKEVGHVLHALRDVHVQLVRACRREPVHVHPPLPGAWG